MLRVSLTLCRDSNHNSTLTLEPCRYSTDHTHYTYTCTLHAHANKNQFKCSFCVLILMNLTVLNLTFFCKTCVSLGYLASKIISTFHAFQIEIVFLSCRPFQSELQIAKAIVTFKRHLNLHNLHLRAVKLKIFWEEWDYCFYLLFLKVLDFVQVV